MRPNALLAAAWGLLAGFLAGARETVRQAFELADAYEPRVEAYFQRKLRVDELPEGSHRRRVATQVDTVLTVVSLGIIIVLGILIYSEVFESTFSSVDNDFANQSDTDNAAFNATDDYGDAMELAPVILIVLIAAVVLGVVQRFR